MMKILDEVVNVECRCPLCGKIHVVKNVLESDLDRWQNGELIQNAMPYLSATEREEMISGFCPACQKSIFGDGEEE